MPRLSGINGGEFRRGESSEVNKMAYAHEVVGENGGLDNNLSAQDLSWEVIYDLQYAARQWRQLEKEGHLRVFQSLAWIDTWYSTIGAKSGVKPRIIIGSVNKKPRVLFPLGLDKYMGCRRLVWLAWNWNDYNAPIVSSDPDFICNPKMALAMWDKVAELAGPVDLVELAKQAPSLGDNLPNSFYHPQSVPEDNSAYVLDLQADVEALMASIHSSKTWKGFARKRRKLEKLGKVKFEEISTSEERRQVTQNMLEVKARELEQHGGGNPFSSPDNIEFLARISQSHPQISRLFALTLDGRPIATTICLTEKTNLIMYQTSYDRTYGSASPGALLLHHIIRYAASQGYLTFDLSFGDDEYKKSVCNRTQQIDRAIIPFSTRGKVAVRMLQAQLLARRQAKSSPLIYGAALAVNKKLRLASKKP